MADPYKYRLDPEELDEIYKLILVDYLGSISSAQLPRLGIISAQTGAGKSTLFAVINNEFNSGEKPAHVDMDELREFNTNLPLIFINHPFDTAFYTNEDAWALTSKLLDDARKLNCNVLYETTLKSIDGIQETIQSYKNEGYAIDLHALAINSKHSIYGVFRRFEDRLSINEPARFVEIDYHDKVYALLPTHVEHLEKSSLLDALSVWRRSGRANCERIYKNDGTYSDSAKQTMERERSRPWTSEEKHEYFKNWQELVHRIKHRSGTDTKPDWYVKAAKSFLREAKLFSKARQASEQDVFDPLQIKAVTHHHIFTHSETSRVLLCFDREEYSTSIAPTRNKVFAPPKAKYDSKPA